MLNLKSVVALLDNTALSLLIFSVVYSVFYALDATLGSQFIAIYAIIPTTLYLAGKMISAEKDWSKFLILFSIGIAYSIPTIASVLMDIANEGFVSIKRDVPLIWTGEDIPATNMAAGCALNMCIPGITLIGFKQMRKKGVLILSILVFAVSLLCVLRLGSRTQIALSLFTLIAAIFYKMQKQSFRQNLGFFIFIFLAANILISYVTLDTDSEVLTAYADRTESKNYGVDSAGGRTDKWQKSISQMFSDPLGWKLSEFGYSHNLWLDAARVGGFLSLILLLIFTGIAFKKVRKLYRLHDQPKLLDGQLLIYSLCFLLSFFVEPILEGYFMLFVICCLVLGIITTHLESTTNALSKT